MARLGKVPQMVFSHEKLELVGILRPEKDAIAFKSLFQETIGLPSKELFIGQPQVKLFKARNCWLSGFSAHIYPDKKSLLSLDEATRKCCLEKICRPMPILASEVVAPIFHMAGNSDSRAHHIMQQLSRYQIAAGYLPSNIAILIHAGQKRWQEDYLKLVKDSVITKETCAGTLFCRELYYVPMASGPGLNLTGQPEHYLALRRRALHQRKLTRRPVFISRIDAPDRRLANEERIFAIAREMIPNLERVSLTGHSFQEQLEQIAGAPLFISPHGQGTHLTLFCEKTVSLQLVPGIADLTNEFYECALLFDYFASLGGQNQTVTVASGIPLKSRRCDWVYPEEKFRKELGAVLRN